MTLLKRHIKFCNFLKSLLNKCTAILSFHFLLIPAHYVTLFFKEVYSISYGPTPKELTHTLRSHEWSSSKDNRQLKIVQMENKTYIHQINVLQSSIRTYSWGETKERERLGKISFLERETMEKGRLTQLLGEKSLLLTPPHLFFKSIFPNILEKA